MFIIKVSPKSEQKKIGKKIFKISCLGGYAPLNYQH